MTELAAVMGRDSPLTLALVLSRVAVAGSEGVLQATVQRELDLAPAVLTRCVQTLSGLHYGKNKPGLDLITRTIDNADSRHRILRLTEKGQWLRHRVEDDTPATVKSLHAEDTHYCTHFA